MSVVKCRRCNSLGTVKIKRSKLRKWMKRPNAYECIDCGHRFIPTAGDRVGVESASASGPTFAAADSADGEDA